MVAADPDLLRVRPVDVTTFWDDLEKALDANPVVGADDAPMADRPGRSSRCGRPIPTGRH